MMVYKKGDDTDGNKGTIKYNSDLDIVIGYTLDSSQDSRYTKYSFSSTIF